MNILMETKVEDLDAKDIADLVNSIGFQYFMDNYAKHKSLTNENIQQYLEIQFLIAIELIKGKRFISMLEQDYGYRSILETVEDNQLELSFESISSPCACGKTSCACSGKDCNCK